MSPSRRATSRPFTVALCAGCGTGDAEILAALRSTTRKCAHGVLVTTACMLGPLTCASRPHGPGAMILVQPCSTDRAPVGPTRWIGPVKDAVDVAEVCSWLEQGQWDYRVLPCRLHAEQRVRAAASRLN